MQKKMGGGVMGNILHVVIVGAILAMFPLSMLGFLIHIILRDYRMDKKEKEEGKR